MGAALAAGLAVRVFTNDKFKKKIGRYDYNKKLSILENSFSIVDSEIVSVYTICFQDIVNYLDSHFFKKENTEYKKQYLEKFLSILNTTKDNEFFIKDNKVKFINKLIKKVQRKNDKLIQTMKYNEYIDSKRMVRGACDMLSQTILTHPDIIYFTDDLATTQRYIPDKFKCTSILCHNKFDGLEDEEIIHKLDDMIKKLKEVTDTSNPADSRVISSMNTLNKYLEQWKNLLQ